MQKVQFVLLDYVGLRYLAFLSAYTTYTCFTTTHRQGLTYEDEGGGQDEGEDISPVGLAVLAVSLGEEDESGVDAVLAESLDQPGHG